MDGTWLETGRELADGRFRLDVRLGQGGMAEVWRAHDTVLDVDRAVKVVLGHGTKLERRMQRMLTEARAMARVRHPNLVAVHDVGEVDGRAYVVMDLVTGGSLQDRVDGGARVGPRLVCAWAIQVLQGLQAAHAAGIVHRDVKPSNILVDERGQALLTDFGIAFFVDAEERLTRDGALMGSLSYMAPEQRSDAKAVDHRADLYGVGAVIYRLVAGSSPMDLFVAAEDSPRWQDVPAALRPVLARAVSQEPDDRFPTALAFAQALTGILDELPSPTEDDQVVLDRLHDGGTLEVGSLDAGHTLTASDSGAEPTFDPVPESPTPSQAGPGTWISISLGSIALATAVVALVLGAEPSLHTPVDRPSAVVIDTEVGFTVAGSWRGEGRALRSGRPFDLLLEGPDHDVTGHITMEFKGVPVAWDVVGWFEPETRTLHLRDEAPSADYATYVLAVDPSGRRMTGESSRAGYDGETDFTLDRL